MALLALGSVWCGIAFVGDGLEWCDGSTAGIGMPLRFVAKPYHSN